MTPQEIKMFTDFFSTMERRLNYIEQQLFNKIKISKIINITDENVHVVMNIVQKWETPDGVIVQVK